VGAAEHDEGIVARADDGSGLLAGAQVRGDLVVDGSGGTERGRGDQWSVMRKMLA
jgi:hypothetical protein